MISDAVVKVQMENLDWTFFRRVIFFFGGGGGGGRVVSFFLVCKKNRVFNLSPTGHIFSLGGGGGGKGGSII